MNQTVDPRVKRKAVWGFTPVILSLAVLGLVSTSAAAAPKHHYRQAAKAKPGVPSARVKHYRMDDAVTRRSNSRNQQAVSSVIVTLLPGAKLPPEFNRYARNTKLQSLDLINSVTLDLPNWVIRRLAMYPNVVTVHDNRPIGKENYRTSVTVGATTVRDTLGYTGAGIGVAVIDSGVSNWHDDLTKGNSSTQYPYGNQRVTKFVDFVGSHSSPYDDNGHGTHVAGIILGNGYDSNGQKSGIAPKASLISLKVLDRNGVGTISNIIAALNWVAANAQTYNIRVVNMSVGARIHESYWTDPLTLATKKVTDKGITVVTAAGNLGKIVLGQKQYGGITAPGNAPWVLTVGASSTMGTLSRNDDTMASYSSRGPTYKDFAAKPDLVAPGTGTLSLAAPGSLFYLTKALYLSGGTFPLGVKPYLTLSGTSMAAPVVSGTVALMLQANPALTPNLIKAILQYTSQRYPGYKPLEQGAGFLNTLGAVRLAKFYTPGHVGQRMPVQSVWSRRIIWGNHMLKGGYLNPRGNAWGNNIVWGTAKTLSNDNIVWGTACDGDCDNIVWGTADDDNIVWGTADDDNIVWGTSDGGDDNIVWGTADGDDNIVWGTDCGGADCDNIVWGTADDDNIVWGTNSDGDVTWGSSDNDDAVVYDDSADGPLPDAGLEFGDVTMTTVTDPDTGITTITVTNLVTGETIVTIVNPTGGL